MLAFGYKNHVGIAQNALTAEFLEVSRFHIGSDPLRGPGMVLAGDGACALRGSRTALNWLRHKESVSARGEWRRLG